MEVATELAAAFTAPDTALPAREKAAVTLAANGLSSGLPPARPPEKESLLSTCDCALAARVVFSVVRCAAARCEVAVAAAVDFVRWIAPKAFSGRQRG